MYSLIEGMIGVDLSTLTTHPQSIVVLACCVVICSGVFFMYRCCDRVFLR